MVTRSISAKSPAAQPPPGLGLALTGSPTGARRAAGSRRTPGSKLYESRKLRAASGGKHHAASAGGRSSRFSSTRTTRVTNEARLFTANYYRRARANLQVRDGQSSGTYEIVAIQNPRRRQNLAEGLPVGVAAAGSPRFR